MVSGLVLGELQSAAQQFHLVAVYSATLTSLVNEYGEFFLGHAPVILDTEELGDHLFPQAEYPAQRQQYPHEKPQKRVRKACKALRRFFGNALRCYFTEYENNYRDHNGGNRSALVLVIEQLYEHHCADGRHRNVDYVVPYQQGGQEPVKVIRKGEHVARALISAFSLGFEPSAVER